MGNAEARLREPKNSLFLYFTLTRDIYLAEHADSQSVCI